MSKQYISPFTETDQRVQAWLQSQKNERLLREELIAACKSKETTPQQIITKLKNNRLNPFKTFNETGCAGFTALQTAVFYNRTDIVIAMLTDGTIDLHATNHQDHTAMDIACEYSLENMAILLAIFNIPDESRKVASNQRDDEGNTLVHHVIRTGDQQLLDFVLKAGASPCTVNNFGQTPYSIAIDKKNYEMAHTLKQKTDFRYNTERRTCYVDSYLNRRQDAGFFTR